MGDDRHIMTINGLRHGERSWLWTVVDHHLGLCLMATFPYGMLQARVVAELTRATGMEIRVVDWTVGLPLGLEWRNVTLSQPNWIPLQLAVLQAKLGVMKALGGTLGLNVVAKLNETPSPTGLAKGTITASSLSLASPVTIKGQVQQVDLSKIIRRYVTHGTLNGDFSHRVDSEPGDRHHDEGGRTVDGRGDGSGDRSDSSRKRTNLVAHIQQGLGRTRHAATSAAT